MQNLTFIAPFLGILSLLIAFMVYLYVKKQPNGNQLMQDLEKMIHEGAMAFLKREYSILVLFIAAVFFLLGLLLGEWKTSIAFVVNGQIFNLFKGRDFSEKVIYSAIWN